MHMRYLQPWTTVVHCCRIRMAGWEPCWEEVDFGSVCRVISLQPVSWFYRKSEASSEDDRGIKQSKWEVVVEERQPRKWRILKMSKPCFSLRLSSAWIDLDAMQTVCKTLSLLGLLLLQAIVAFWHSLICQAQSCRNTFWWLQRTKYMRVQGDQLSNRFGGMFRRQYSLDTARTNS